MFNFSKVFTAMRGVETAIDEEFANMKEDITITNNNGYIVIVGKIKSVNVNGTIVNFGTGEKE